MEELNRKGLEEVPLEELGLCSDEMEVRLLLLSSIILSSIILSPHTRITLVK